MKKVIENYSSRIHFYFKSGLNLKRYLQFGPIRKKINQITSRIFFSPLICFLTVSGPYISFGFHLCYAHLLSVFNLNFLQFMKDRKSFETKTEGSHKFQKQKYASVSFIFLHLEVRYIIYDLNFYYLFKPHAYLTETRNSPIYINLLFV